MTFQEFIQDILIIVVLYKKRISESESIISITKSLGNMEFTLFVYDNSPGHNPKPELSEDLVKLHYVADQCNSGVSKAYNTGYDYAVASGKKWMVLCDQDTHFHQDYFKDLYQTMISLSPPLIAPYLFSDLTLISPCGFRLNYAYRLKEKPGNGWKNLKRISLLNSGLCIPVNVFGSCSGYNEGVFLDFSDLDFIKKYKRQYPSFYLLKSKLAHHLETDRFDDQFNHERFKKYCKSYRGAIHNGYDLITMSAIVILRTLKKCAKYHTFEPMRIMFNSYIANH